MFMDSSGCCFFRGLVQVEQKSKGRWVLSKTSHVLKSSPNATPFNGESHVGALHSLLPLSTAGVAGGMPGENVGSHKLCLTCTFVIVVAGCWVRLLSASTHRGSKRWVHQSKHPRTTRKAPIGRSSKPACGMLSPRTSRRRNFSVILKHMLSHVSCFILGAKKKGESRLHIALRWSVCRFKPCLEL